VTVTLDSSGWKAADGGLVCENYKSSNPFSDRQEEVKQMNYVFVSFYLEFSNI
jgi:hypothetical protein